MARPVTNLPARRRRAAQLTFLAGAVLVFLFASRSLALRDTAFLSGWSLLGGVLFLSLYNVRKKLPYPPLGRSSSWLQIHVWIGWIALLLFGIHLGFRIPNGLFEGILAGTFLLVAGSGIAGLLLSRALPSRLTVRGEEVLFERIPAFRGQLRERAEALALDQTRSSRNPVLRDLYFRRLAAFFAAPRHFWRHLLQSGRPLHHLLEEIGSLDRYLNEEERGVARKLDDLVRTKDALDYHRAMQGLLKGWLFVHVPLTFALLVFAFVHLVLVHAFSAGAG